METVILIFSSIAFVLSHLLMSSDAVRRPLASHFGEWGFMGLYSLVALLTLGAMIYAYAKIPTPSYLWLPGAGLRHVPLLVMPFAFILLVAGYTTRNPSAIGMTHHLQRADVARGVFRITRHPIMWGLMLWAAVHILANGDLASLVFFGSLLLTALLGSLHLEQRMASAQGEPWQRFAAVTSYLPFAAILGGRQSLVWKELLMPIGVGLIVFVVLLLLHSRLFGVMPY